MSRSLGILPDRTLDTLDVPGTVLLYQDSPPGSGAQTPDQHHGPELIKTKEGIVLSPQPHEDPNDPLNWHVWRRNVMLLVLGVHCLIGGGQTPILAAGFHTISNQFGVSLTKMSLTTGVYMLFLGIGSAILSPTALLYGKRPVYLFGQLVFLVGCIWCASAPSWTMLLIGRMITGIGVSPCECLPSSSIAEIFFLHERAFRLGIYTMLLLGGKNLVPLVSAAVIQSIGWRWVFIIVGIIVAVMFVLTYLCVPETSWDRTPITSDRLHRRASRNSLPRNRIATKESNSSGSGDEKSTDDNVTSPIPSARVRFAEVDRPVLSPTFTGPREPRRSKSESTLPKSTTFPHGGQSPPTSSPAAIDLTIAQVKRSSSHHSLPRVRSTHSLRRLEKQEYAFQVPPQDIELVPSNASVHSTHTEPDVAEEVTYRFRKKTYREMLAVYQGRISNEKWWKAALRPFILYSYPAIAFATLLYSLSVVWLIVLSEVVGQIFQAPPYDLSPLSIGLLYLAPFIGGVMGSALSGKISDVVCRYMTRRNGGIFEPEFRLFMVIFVAFSTVLGLWGFGWSAQVADPWIAPTVFFGVIGFGCTLGSTVSISFVVDSYRADAGSSLTSLNFSKNVIGFIFSLVTNNAISHLGVRGTFLILGGIHLGVCFLAIPLYIFGKRFRGWTHRKGMMDWLYDD